MVNGKNIKLVLAFIPVLLLWVTGSMAQISIGHKYPQGYFRNPLNIPISLTANFGELRDAHWHMGFDLRTDAKENYPVFAAADGYVAYAGIRPLSFGKFMIIIHPNGYSTVYAHLKTFFPELETYVNEQQYKKESWAIELSLPEWMFAVKKSDTIARSGNTGGSKGPHLHFEIRDTKTGHSLNPLLFGFDVKDNVPPLISGLALYDGSISTYLQTPKQINIKKTDKGFYTLPQKILTGFNKIGFAIGAIDRVLGSPNPNGIYNAVIYFDEKPQTEFLLDNIDYGQSEYVNAHIDHVYKENTGIYLQYLFQLPGEKSSVYHDIEGNGIIELNDSLEHAIRIEVMDENENVSELFMTVQYSDSLARMITRLNTIRQKFIPNYVNVFEQKDFEVYMPQDCLFDTVSSFYYSQNLFIPGSVSSNHRLNDPSIPLYEDIIVRIKPVVPIPENQKNKIVIVREWQGNKSVKKASWQSDPIAIGWVSASFGNFGNFQAFIDQAPPQIEPPVKTRLPDGQEKDTLDFSPLNRIVFTPTDNFYVKSFRAELNGKWIMFSNDKAKDFIYQFEENFPYGVYELKVKVEDLVGNTTEKKWWFKREPYTTPKKPLVPLKGRLRSKTSIKKK